MLGRQRSRGHVRHKPGTAAAPMDPPGAMTDGPRLFDAGEADRRPGRPLPGSIDDQGPGELDQVAASTRGQEVLLQRSPPAALGVREDERAVLALSLIHIS